MSKATRDLFCDPFREQAARLEQIQKRLAALQDEIKQTALKVKYDSSQDEKLVGGFILYFVVGSGDGKTSDVMRRPQGLGIPPIAEKAIRAKPMTYTTAIRVNPGESVLSVGIVDQLSGATGFARAKIFAR